MLKKNGIAADSRIENPDMQQAFQTQQEQRDGDHRSAKNENDAGGINSPDKKRQAKPGESRSTHFVNSDDEIEPGKNRRKSGDEHAERGGDHRSVGKAAAIGRVKRPAGVDSAGNHGVEREDGADDVDVPAEQIEPWKRQVTRADQHGHKDIPKRRRNRR